MLRIFFPDDPRAPEGDGMKEKEHGMQPVLKGITLLMVNEFIFCNEETGENTKSKIDFFMLRSGREIEEEKKGRNDCQGIQRMSQSLPERKSSPLMNMEFINHHHNSLEDERKINHHATSKTAPIIVRPGPKARATTGVPLSGFDFTISSQT